MIFTWEETDITMGRWANNESPSKFLLCIGFCSALKEKKYGVTEIGSDGMFLPLGNKTDVAAYLNKHGYKPCEKAN